MKQNFSPEIDNNNNKRKKKASEQTEISSVVVRMELEGWGRVAVAVSAN